MRLSVLLVDRHPVVREGLRAWLAGSDFDVVADVATSGEALEAGHASFLFPSTSKSFARAPSSRT